MSETKRKSVIYVFDDNEVMRLLMRMHLENAGYEVHVFEDAVDGARAMLGSPPDLLISDVNMPYLDGLELLDALKTDTRTAKVPTIMVTSRTDPLTEMRAVEGGAARFLTKPLDRQLLLEAVEKVLRERSPANPPAS